jgi:glutamyl-tRNA synthetase
MSLRRVRVRFAPSPTGPLHMGGVRTALYSYLFAKKHGGDFLLRIEDTDQTRFVPGAEQYIIDSLKWCGIEPNEGVGFGDGPHAPYRQSERKPMYKQYAEQLVRDGYAYLAFDTAEEMDALRKEAETNKQTFAYDSSSRLNLRNSLTMTQEAVEAAMAAGETYVIRLKVPRDEEIRFTDLIRGEVKFNSNVVDDKVLLKGDGMPTYHLAHIVDDYLMQITHAIRGEEWLPSAPGHILTYRYLGWEDQMPAYAHLPLLLKPDGNGKLSKRDGDRLGFPVFPMDWNDPSSGELSSGYKERGYMPEAFVNMLAFLGWNPGTEKEIFSLTELSEAFHIEQVQHAGAKFDPEKAKWFNEQHLRLRDAGDIAHSLRSQVAQQFGLNADDLKLTDAYLIKAVELLKPRVQFENEMPRVGSYLFEAPQEFDQAVIDKKWKAEYLPFFEALKSSFAVGSAQDEASIKLQFEETCAAHQLKPGEVLQLLRIFVSGQSGGVDLFGMLALLGAHECANRLTAAMENAVKKA